MNYVRVVRVDLQRGGQVLAREIKVAVFLTNNTLN